MSEQKAIVPMEQREIPFYDDMVIAVVAKDGTVYVPVKPLCDLIGVDWHGQRQRIGRDPILSDEMSECVIHSDIDERSKRPKTSTMICLPLDCLNGWLFGISANRVREEIRDTLLRYQRECYRILFDAFSSGVAVRHDETLLQSNSPQASAYRVGLAVAKLAREQFYLSQRVDEHDRRIGLLEAQMSNPAAYITQEQAQQISEAVKAIATVSSKRSGKNEFGAVYGELYRRYGVTSYKHIPTGHFDHVMGWLREWWQTLTDGSDAPF